jgi:DNA-binding transcriptional LysR family regulator
MHEPFFQVVSAGHPILHEEELMSEHFREELFLINEKGCTYRTLFDQFLKQRGG